MLSQAFDQMGAVEARLHEKLSKMCVCHYRSLAVVTLWVMLAKYVVNVLFPSSIASSLDVFKRWSPLMKDVMLSSS